MGSSRGFPIIHLSLVRPLSGAQHGLAAKDTTYQDEPVPTLQLETEMSPCSK